MMEFGGKEINIGFGWENCSSCELCLWYVVQKRDSLVEDKYVRSVLLIIVILYY